jgi:ABC-type amino acid transport system permease subunit
MAVVAALVIGMGYGRWARSRAVGGGLIDAQRWPIVLALIGVPFAATLLAAFLYDAAFPSVDHCGTTDRHVLPFIMTLSTFPAVWIGSLAGAWWMRP